MNGSHVAVANLLNGWLDRRLPEQAREWLRQAVASAAASDRALFLAIGLAPRKVGKADLSLSADELAAAADARARWEPRFWTVDQAARLLLVLASEPERLRERLERLFVAADVGELVTFYRGLPIYPEPLGYLARAAEGARSNMRSVFEAVAHRNPYPAECFPEPMWNQMVLKALFIDSPLDPIIGFDERRNATLARMLCDYAHERWAASRSVSPELWRGVGPFADDAAIADLGRALADADEQCRAGAGLALSQCPVPEARRMLERHPKLLAKIRAGRVTWAQLAPGADS